jgi:hypothetical protein
MSYTDSETVNSFLSSSSDESSSDDSFVYEQPLPKSSFNKRSKIIGRLNERYKLHKPYKLRVNVCVHTCPINNNYTPRILYDFDTDSSF